MPKVQTFITANEIPGVKRNITPALQASIDELKGEIRLFARAFAAVDTGEMRDKIEETPQGVVARANHSSFNEFGTRYMAAQPFMRPALARAAGDLPRYFGGFGVRLRNGGGPSYGAGGG